MLGKIKTINIETNELYKIISNFWKAIQIIFKKEWGDHRHHLLTKGLGVNSLTMLLADIILNYNVKNVSIQRFKEILSPLKNIDWRSDGMFASFGGHKGSIEVYKKLKGLIII